MTHSHPQPHRTAAHQHQHRQNNGTPPRHQRFDSKFSLSPDDESDQTETARPWPHKTQSYMASLIPPSQENFERIARIQEEKELALRHRDRELRQQLQHERKSAEIQRRPDSSHARTNAAKLIQKTYRGHRTRREMEGFGLDASTRWISAIREAEFRAMTRPVSKAGPGVGSSSSNGTENPNPSSARLKWKKASIVARRAGYDDLESDDSSSVSSASTDASPEEKNRIRHLRDKLLEGRRHQAQMMGLQYFLEMVDVKHRYGSNLRTYHAEWKKTDTDENFFYWLDYGEGRNVELSACPRDRLEREKIRYLSREERQYYLVKIDNEGRLRWAKNDVRIDTTEKFKDSVHGIVPADDPTPAFDPATQPRPSSVLSKSRSSSGSISSVKSEREADRAAKYADPASDEPAGFKRVTHISASTVWNKLLRRSVRDGTWIFVADTSFRLYVGIKNSGAFQHSSFLQGSRISAAGLIKIKNGRISSLSPLSGHYRPPASNFHAFVKALREGGVDMSHVSISKSYAILVGLEAYVKTRRKSKKFLEKMLHQKNKIVDPEEVRRQEEEAQDKSESAKKEREIIEREEEEREQNRAAVKMMEKLKISPREPRADSDVIPHANDEVDGAVASAPMMDSKMVQQATT